MYGQVFGFQQILICLVFLKGQLRRQQELIDMPKVRCPICSKRTISEYSYLTSSRGSPSTCSSCKSSSYMKNGRKFIYMSVCSLFFWGVVIVINYFKLPYLISIIVLPLMFFYTFKIVFYNAKMTMKSSGLDSSIKTDAWIYKKNLKGHQ